MNPQTKRIPKMTARKSGLLGLAMICFASSAAAAPARGSLSEPMPIAQERVSSIDSESLHAQLAARRSLNLTRLLDYAKAGTFPQNHVSPGPLNVFVDDLGHICAAANLIDKDGFKKLVQDTARYNNYTVLANVHEGPLMDWMLTSGFTQEEIALIQEPYMPVGDLEPIDDPNIPEPIFAAAPATAEEERARVQAVLLGVHKLLSANTKKSLGTAVARLEANPKLAQAFSTQPRAPRFAKAP